MMLTTYAVVMALAAPAALGLQSWNRGLEKLTGEFGNMSTGYTPCGTAAQTSGYFNIKGSGKTDLNYFFWFAEAVNSPKTAPVSMWLTGGPGCSSMLALLFENGPCRVRKDPDACQVPSNEPCGKDNDDPTECTRRGCCPVESRCFTPQNVEVETNEWSWNTNSNMLWLDQPANVGFSYGAKGDNDKNEDQVAEDAYYFLKEFHEYLVQRDAPYADHPFYVIGESYGGHYAPSVAERLYRGLKAGDQNMNLQGLAVGNGLTNPAIQYQYFPTMIYNNSYDIKMCNLKTYNKMSLSVPRCVKLINECQTTTAACRYAQSVCNANLINPFYYNTKKLNQYDIRIPCDIAGLCYDFSKETHLLNEPSVQAQLGVNTKWASCNYNVNSEFGADWMKDQSPKVKELLDGGIRVLIYAGDADYMCNWYGNRAWTLALNWTGHDDFNSAEDKFWLVNGKQAGEARTGGGFTFLRVYGAGHMVPFDQPVNSMHMIDNFRSNKPLV